MRLFIAEKPDLAKAVVSGIGGHFEKKDGYFESTNDIVTWCYGHLLELKSPEDFDPSYKAWTMESLPLKLYPVQLQPKDTAKKQTKTVLDLIKKADEIVHTGDPDDEGQLLVDELLIYANNKKPVKRLLINDLEDNAVKESLKNMRSNSDFQGLYKKALARSVADAIYGISLTRACTIKANQRGTVFSVGRVQTPVLGLITKRYLDFKEHKKSFYYVLKSKFNDSFEATYSVKDDAPVDDKKRIINQDYLKEIQTKISGKHGSITDIRRESKETTAPLPYNLAKLQQDMSNKYGYTAAKTLEITQELREKYKAITYNRSDCSYLSSEQFEQSPRILKNVIGYFGNNLSFNENQKTSAFDDSKITAHTAIIPTESRVNIDSLTQEQKNVYRAVCERFLVQFLPTKKFDVITATVSIENEIFKLKAQNLTDKGFTVLLSETEETENEENEVSSNFSELEKLSKNDSVICSSANVEAKETKPKPLFTEASLLSALVRVADFVEDPKIKALLKSKDKDKKDEHGGIGTPATRHTFTEILKKRGFIELSGKNLIPTSLGIDYYNSLPQKVLLPDLTALMFEQQELIEKNELSVDDFVNNIYLDIETILNDIKTSGLSEIKKVSDLDYQCPFCKNNLDSLPKLVKCTDKNCGFIIWKEIASKKLTDNQIKTLITKRETSEIKGFKAKSGKPFDAKLKLNDDKKVNFEFSQKK